MPIYTWHDPALEILGKNMVGFIRCTCADVIRPYLVKYDFLHIRARSWYPVQQCLKMLSDISEAHDAMLNLVSIGMKMAEVVSYPPEYAHLTYEKIFMDSDRRYQEYHRNGDAGRQWPSKIDEKHLLLKTRVPYPDDLVYGILYGVTRKFIPPGTQFVLYFDALEPSRDQGGNCTAIHVEWE